MNTPRTDRAATTIKDYAGYDEVVPADVCRDIERDLDKMTEDRDYWVRRDIERVLAKMTEDRDYWKAILTASLDQAFETTNEKTMRTHESEYKRLEDTISELKRDKERLDWLLKNCLIKELDLEWVHDSRETIDEAIKGEL